MLMHYFLKNYTYKLVYMITLNECACQEKNQETVI